MFNPNKHINKSNKKNKKIVLVKNGLVLTTKRRKKVVYYNFFVCRPRVGLLDNVWQEYLNLTHDLVAIWECKPYVLIN